MNRRLTHLTLPLLLVACGDTTLVSDAGGSTDANEGADAGAARSSFGGSYAGPGSLQIAAMRVRAQGGHVVLARFVSIEGSPRPERVPYGNDPNAYSGERTWAVARYVVVDSLGESISGEFRVEALLLGERIFSPDGSVVLDENNVPFMRDHLLHPTAGTHVLFLRPSRTDGVWWTVWRTSLDGTTVSGEGTALREDASLDSLRRP